MRDWLGPPKGCGATAGPGLFPPHRISVTKFSPSEDNGPRGRFRAARGPGDGLVMFPTDILLLIPLMAAGILSRLSLPPQSRRGYRTLWLSAREEPLTPSTDGLMTPPEPDTLSPRERALHSRGRTRRGLGRLQEAPLHPGPLSCSLLHRQVRRRQFLPEWDRHSCLSPSPLRC